MKSSSYTLLNLVDGDQDFRDENTKIYLLSYSDKNYNSIKITPEGLIEKTGDILKDGIQYPMFILEENMEEKRLEMLLLLAETKITKYRMMKRLGLK